MGARFVVAAARPSMWLLTLACASLLAAAGCKQRTQHETGSRGEGIKEAPSLIEEMTGDIPIAKAAQYDGKPILIPEENFLALLQQKTRTLDSASRAASARAAAVALAPSTLGAFAVPESGWVDGALFVVAKDWHIGKYGYAETRDFYIAAVALSGETPYAVDPSFALTKKYPPEPRCDDLARGCRPVFADGAGTSLPHLWAADDEGSVGLSADTILNAEAAGGPSNASGATPQLRLYGRPGGKDLVSTAYECRGQVDIFSTCANFMTGSRDLAARSVGEIPLKSEGGIIVMREADYVQLLTYGSHSDLQTDYLSDAVRVATMGNEPVTMGVTADLKENANVKAGIVLVVRDPSIDWKGRLEATEWYVSALAVSGVVPMAGVNPYLQLDGPFDRFDGLDGPCGQVSLPRDTPMCEACMPPQTPVYSDPRIGSDRWGLGMPRVSIRLPVSSLPTRLSNVFVCNEFLPPPQTASPCSNASELCNGIDDNCNGIIDEGRVCEAGCTP